MQQTRREFMQTLAGLLMASCSSPLENPSANKPYFDHKYPTGEYVPYYLPSDPKKTKDFLKEMNIYRAQDTPRQTFLRLTDWLTLNVSHMAANFPGLHTDPNEDYLRGQFEVLDILNTRFDQGVIVMGCYGIASIYEHLLKSIGQDINYRHPKLKDEKGRSTFHTTITFQDLGLYHADNVLHQRFAMQEGKIHRQFDTEALFVDQSIIHDNNDISTALDTDVLRRIVESYHQTRSVPHRQIISALREYDETGSLISPQHKTLPYAAETELLLQAAIRQIQGTLNIQPGDFIENRISTYCKEQAVKKTKEPIILPDKIPFYKGNLPDKLLDA